MRVRRSAAPLFAILTTLAACVAPGGTPDAPAVAAPAAVAPVALAAPAVAEPAPAAVAVSVRWDSGPLDRAYHAERIDMDQRHSRERAAARTGESMAQRLRRQEEEDQTLELRYSRGKAAHSRTLPGL